MKDILWNCSALPITGGIHAGENSAEALEDQFVHKAAAVVPNIYDETLFANLRKILLYEFVEARAAHIWQIDIADFAAGGRIHLLAIGLNHLQFAELILVVDGFDLDVARAIFRRLGIYRERRRLVPGVLKQFVGILRRA